jgi:hypothetical protein
LSALVLSSIPVYTGCPFSPTKYKINSYAMKIKSYLQNLEIDTCMIKII